MNTTQIEDQLKRKCEQEIAEMTTRWTNELKAFQDKYKIRYTHYELSETVHSKTTKLLSKNETLLGYLLEESICNELVEKMVKVKTAQLLEKLELI